jgi:hypothetical protein
MQQMMSSDKLLDRTPVFLLAENNVSPVLTGQGPFARDRSSEGLKRREVTRTHSLMMERIARDDLKWYLVNKYRALFIDKLTCEDLEELQCCLRQQYDPKRGWDRRYLQRFVLKLREHVQEEILKREIAGIETVVRLMKPEDLKIQGQEDHRFSLDNTVISRI